MCVKHVPLESFECSKTLQCRQVCCLAEIYFPNAMYLQKEAEIITENNNNKRKSCARWSLAFRLALFCLWAIIICLQPNKINDEFHTTMWHHNLFVFFLPEFRCLKGVDWIRRTAWARLHSICLRQAIPPACAFVQLSLRLFPQLECPIWT